MKVSRLRETPTAIHAGTLSLSRNAYLSVQPCCFPLHENCEHVQWHVAGQLADPRKLQEVPLRNRVPRKGGCCLEEVLCDGEGAEAMK